MGRHQDFNSDTPRQLIPYDYSANSSPGSCNNGVSPDTNRSLNSSNTNTSSTCSTTRQLNKKNAAGIANENDHDLIITISKNIGVYDYASSEPISKQEETQDFLPICDALFNVICLVCYFCDIVFDVLTAYTFYQDGLVSWSIVALSFITMSMFLNQCVSFIWYKEKRKSNQEPPCSTSSLIFLHLSLCGVLWRYFKLFIPVDLRHVKSEVRDLCLLRLIHAFTEAAPMLLIQLYLIFSKPTPGEVTDLTIVSTALSLFTVCWALASYSKNVRRQNVHKLVLTWLGVIFQFLWRLGTVISRVLALAVYATVYQNWIFLVLILHWFSMLMWLISPKHIFHGEKMTAVKKGTYSALIAVVYVFCYINVQEVNSRQRVFIFYVTMFLENLLLVGVWLIPASQEELWYKQGVVTLVFVTFALGILFMCLYYKYFHIKKLSYAYDAETNIPGRTSSNNNGANTAYYSSVVCGFGTSDYCDGKRKADFHSTECEFGNLSNNPGAKHPFYSNKINGHHIHHPNVPGVFNCRFNPAIKRKKKKPTSFVPPPPVADVISTAPPVDTNESIKYNQNTTHPKKMANPFWKRPLSITVGSENEGSIISSRADIHRKLQEKKQQQLQDLRQIEEEIKEGKLRPPAQRSLTDDLQCVPIHKKQPWFRGGRGGLPSIPPIVIPRPDELILDPTYLLLSPNSDGHRSPPGFYDRVEWMNFYHEPVYQNDEDEVGFSDIEEDDDYGNGESISDMMNESESRGGWKRKRRKRNQNSKDRDGIYKSYRLPSDIDSQVSLPRSYTLPRKFKYERKIRKTVKAEHFLPSTNSSDGDVDSGEEDYAHVMPYQLPLPSLHNARLQSSGQKRRLSGPRKQKQPETPL